MNKEIIIRNAKIDDFEQVHSLIMQVHSLHVKERNDIYKEANPLTLEDYKAELLKDNNIYLAAELENKVVGICFSNIREISNNRIMKDRRILHIEDICVDISKRRKGIGEKLYNAIIKKAKDNKVDSIELLVWGFNDDAIKFYEKLGMSIKNIRFEQNLKF